MHPIEDMTRFVEVFLTHAVQRGRAARAPDRARSGGYERTRELPPLPESAQRSQEPEQGQEPDA